MSKLGKTVKTFKAVLFQRNLYEEKELCMAEGDLKCFPNRKRLVL